MKLEVKGNPNYAAAIVRINHLTEFENADRIVGVPMFGLQAIVGRDTKIGDLGVFFPAESQLSFDYAFHNSLHSHATKAVMGNTIQLNADLSAKGYLGDNRRVRAITLRGNRSDALYMPLWSLAYLAQAQGKPFDASEFHEGMTFDTIDGVEVCRKYVIPGSGRSAFAGQKKRETRVESRVFPEHFETPQFFRVGDNLDPAAYCVVTQKLHGTSFRGGLISVRRELTILEKILLKVGLAYVDGS